MWLAGEKSNRTPQTQRAATATEGNAMQMRPSHTAKNKKADSRERPANFGGSIGSLFDWCVQVRSLRLLAIRLQLIGSPRLKLCRFKSCGPRFESIVEDIASGGNWPFPRFHPAGCIR